VQTKNNTQASVTTGTPLTATFPARWFYGFLRALRGDQTFLSPSLAGTPANLTSALGRPDHTTSPSASALHVSQRHPRPPQARLACRDVRETPLKVESGCRQDGANSEKTKGKYFCEKGWTTPTQPWPRALTTRFLNTSPPPRPLRNDSAIALAFRASKPDNKAARLPVRNHSTVFVVHTMVSCGKERVDASAPMKCPQNRFVRALDKRMCSSHGVRYSRTNRQ
jgi:hypothetical protein